MQKLLKLIDNFPLPMLIVMSIFLGLAPYLPFMAEPPHLFAKLNMLVSGTLTKPVDIFDLLLHGIFPLLLLIRTARILMVKAEA